MWTRSSKCEGGHCLEMRKRNGNRALRQSERQEHIIFVSEEEWQAFIAGVKAGDFD